MNRIWNTSYGNVTDVEHSIIEHLTREEHRMHAIIYTKQNCPKCRMTVNLLSKAMQVQTITADERDYKRFRELGYQSMPVVTVYKQNGSHDCWCDFRVDKIKQYTEK